MHIRHLNSEVKRMERSLLEIKDYRRGSGRRDQSACKAGKKERRRGEGGLGRVGGEGGGGGLNVF